jgi:hypothetical protein
MHFGAPRGRPAALRVPPRRRTGTRNAMFLFFSNRMGCLPSLLLSAVVTLVLLVATGVIRLG